MLRRTFAVVIAVAAFSGAGAFTAPGEALADRCQPEELVLGSGNSPIGHDEDDPRCPIMQNVLYDQVACDQSKFTNCVMTFSAVGTAQRQQDECWSRYGFRGSALICPVVQAVPVP